jgi:hypothetical protein
MWWSHAFTYTPAYCITYIPIFVHTQVHMHIHIHENEHVHVYIIHTHKSSSCAYFSMQILSHTGGEQHSGEKWKSLHVFNCTLLTLLQLSGGQLRSELLSSWTSTIWCVPPSVCTIGKHKCNFSCSKDVDGRERLYDCANCSQDLVLRIHACQLFTCMPVVYMHASCLQCCETDDCHPTHLSACKGMTWLWWVVADFSKIMCFEILLKHSWCRQTIIHILFIIYNCL